MVKLSINPFDAANNSILNELQRYKERADKANPIPIGTERVPLSTVKARLAAMKPHEREAFLMEHGSRALEMLEE